LSAIFNGFQLRPVEDMHLEPRDEFSSFCFRLACFFCFFFGLSFSSMSVRTLADFEIPVLQKVSVASRTFIAGPFTFPFIRSTHQRRSHRQREQETFPREHVRLLANLRHRKQTVRVERARSHFDFRQEKKEKKKRRTNQTQRNSCAMKQLCADMLYVPALISVQNLPTLASPKSRKNEKMVD